MKDGDTSAMKDTSKKAFYFDLSIHKLKTYFDEENPNYAYTLIERYMKKHNIVHRQWSGYVSDGEMTFEEGVSFCKEMSKQFPWLHLCARRFDMTNIPKTFDMIPYLSKPYINEYVQTLSLQYPLLVETTDEYKLYKKQDETYLLFDEYDNEVGITDCDNIEEALEELRENEQDLEL